MIIPTLNEEGYIGDLLRKLVQVPDLEIIVSDGGSRDRTLAICRSLGIRTVSSPAGRGRQLNAGAGAATGDIFFFLHADSCPEEQVFPEIRQAVAEGSSWGCCSLVFSENTLFYRLVAAASRSRARFTSSCYGDQGIFCTRELFNRVGGFPEFPFLEDLAFSHRLRRQEKARVLQARIVTSTRRFRQNGPGRTLFKMQLVKLLFILGVPPARLIGFYQGAKKVD
ncbi:hypothetical protein MTKAM_19820 [Moorella thermoacetica]